MGSWDPIIIFINSDNLGVNALESTKFERENNIATMKVFLKDAFRPKKASRYF